MGRPPIDEETREWIRRLRRKKMTIDAIAAATNLSPSAIQRVVADMPVDRRAAANKARTKAAPPWLNDARALLKEGMSRHAVAGALGVTKSTVYRDLERFKR